MVNEIKVLKAGLERLGLEASSAKIDDIVKNCGYGEYQGEEKIPDEFPKTKAIQILQRNNYDMDLIELFQEMGYPPDTHGADELTKKNFNFSYDRIDKEVGGFGNFFYVRPEEDSYGRVLLTDKGFDVVKGKGQDIAP